MAVTLEPNVTGLNSVFPEMRIPATAVAFAVDRSHPQYAGKLDLETQLALVCQGSGVSGNCADYVLSTAAHLRELGVEDHLLQALAERLAPEAV